MTGPDETTCATCGGVARRCSWAGSLVAHYRCTKCHAGGHVATDGHQEVRQGGVFEQLDNFASRGARA